MKNLLILTQVLFIYLWWTNQMEWYFMLIPILLMLINHKYETYKIKRLLIMRKNATSIQKYAIDIELKKLGFLKHIL